MVNILHYACDQSKKIITLFIPWGKSNGGLLDSIIGNLSKNMYVSLISVEVHVWGVGFAVKMFQSWFIIRKNWL